ncbi:ABC transporter permease [Aneurinibacillus sp. Ricciae_BoGa-3]|uniref:ABC transporter permease n=1 Tax=Aneurinibacillus sp. Ricciae_BoGa-3 TaxID=3022697 RepID=UPI002342579E|nr:ABC transporter permease [Aneurinibacillus sp. Ricciae_BoGa-3]WCK54406.1 ABC transporter permease [Aneurinibacillus sp. Ricciae_BoGa-3]
MSVQQLWKQRAASFWGEALQYSRYIGNSGTITFLVFAFIAGAYYYSVFIRWLPQAYPVEWGMAAVFAFGLSFGSVRTFLKEADTVYLLPLEWKMGAYFRLSIRYSFILQALYLFGLLLVVWPLYRHRMADHAWPFIALLLYLLFLKAGNLLASWQEQRLREQGMRRLHFLVRLAANYAVAAVLFSRGIGTEIAILTLVYFGGGWAYYRLLERKYINWQQLLAAEGKAKSRFYFFINWFVDVPGIETRVNRRPILSSLAGRTPFMQKNTYAFLYGKAFVRSDLPGMLFRLAVVAILLIWLVRNPWGKVLVYAIFLYASAIQLATIRQLHRYVFWHHVYPLPQGLREEALVRIVYRVLLVVAGVLFVPVALMAGNLLPAAAAAAIGVAISYLYSHSVFLRGLKQTSL